MTSYRLGLVLACVLWALSFIATKVALGQVPPLGVVSLRLLLSALCFLVWLQVRRLPLRATLRAHLWPLFILSLLGTGLHYGTQTIGLQYTSASNASVYAATGPLSIAAISVLVLGERLTLIKGLGIALALAGVLVVMGPETLLAFDLTGHLGGDLLVLLSLVLWAMFTVYGKQRGATLGTVELIALATLLGAVWMLPVGVVEMLRVGFDPRAIAAAPWLAIAFLGVGCSFLATLLYFRALQVMSAQSVGVYLYAIPPLTVLAAALWLDEKVGASLVAGALLVLAGVALTERSAARR